jgi:myo-inositol-1(or 4)-monophosphatase
MNSEVRVAIDAARTGGAALRARWATRAAGLGTKTSSTDVVLDADRASEAEVVRVLRGAFPDDAVIAEEGTDVGAGASRRWYVDPLDGTVNYLYGIPHFAVAIACEDDEGLLAAVVFDPARDELFTAARGAGAWLGPDRLSVSTADDLGAALVATGFAYVAGSRAVQADLLTAVLPHVRDIRRNGSAQLDLAWVAAGRIDAYFESVDKPWDWKAGALLVREAGGRVSELAQTRAGDPHIVASAPAIHDDLVAMLARATRA